MTTTTKPVEGDGWYERRDGTVAEYRWTGGLLVEVRAVASWAEVAQVKRDDEMLLAAQELDRCYAEADEADEAHARAAVAAGLCPNCGDLAHVSDPCPAPDPEELRRAALDHRGRP